MQYLSAENLYIPANTDKKVYPVAISLVISLFVIVTVLGISGAAPDVTKLSHNFNIIGSPIALLSPAKELPVRIVIPSLSIDSTISNPVKSDIESLDDALLQGVVRYPGSGLLGSKGNMILFGHSSHLAFVNNKAYKSLNDIDKLSVGDEITVYSSESSYIYKVTKVSKVKASDAGADIKSSVSKLTLITCNNFGSKEDRFIVEAQLSK